MAQTEPVASPVSDMDPRLETLIKWLQGQAGFAAAGVLAGEQAFWMMPPTRADSLRAGAGSGGPDEEPEKWEGDLFDVQAMEQPFDRSQSNAWFTKAISDGRNPGTSGDHVVTQIQADYLAVMERAFRSCYTMRRPRAAMHAMARRAGHGSDTGPLVVCVLEYLRGLVKANKA